MDRAVAIETISAAIKASKECLILVDDGACSAASRPAAALLGGSSGSVNALMENIVAARGQSKLKAAWTRAHKRQVSTATIDTDLLAGSVQLQFYKFDDALHLLRFEIETDGPLVPASEGQVNNVDDTAESQGSASHPDLPPAYSRQAFLDAVENADAVNQRTDMRLALIHVQVTGLDNSAYWQSCSACKAVLLRLNDVVRGHDTIAHLGGSGFGVVQQAIRQDGDMARLCHRIVEAMREPFLDEDMPASVELAMAAELFDHSDMTVDVVEEFLAKDLSPMVLSEPEIEPEDASESDLVEAV